jgi:hypothetical protein
MKFIKFHSIKATAIATRFNVLYSLSQRITSFQKLVITNIKLIQQPIYKQLTIYHVVINTLEILKLNKRQCNKETITVKSHMTKNRNMRIISSCAYRSSIRPTIR